MKALKQFVCAVSLLCLTAIDVLSQSMDGIQWTTGLNLQQLKEKAKQENKFIFLDCYTTWCGPCKAMDKQVYSNDTVGNFFNDKFISVRVQMDKTKNDDAFIQSWYKDADSLNKRYATGYPSFIFLSPQGNITDVSLGFKPANEFIKVAKAAIAPGKQYDDLNAKYIKLVDEYNQGIKHYGEMPFMIRTSLKLGEQKFAKTLLDEHTNYVSGLGPKERYTKENIELWASFLLNQEGKRFEFFYKDADIINRVMGQKDYAERVVDRTIQSTVVRPFFESLPKGKEMYENLPVTLGQQAKTDYDEPDWNKLYGKIQKKFNSKYAKRNLIVAKTFWYQKKNNFSAWLKYYPKSLEISGIDAWINDNAWKIFLKVNDKNTLNEIIPWMKKALVQYPKAFTFVDTYANLLYKVGRTKEAIRFEEKAINMAISESDKEGYRKTLETMKRGEHTYLELGAVWE